MTEYGATAWGQAWLRLAEPTRVTGIDTRLPRARSLARRGDVRDVKPEPGRITACVTVRDRDFPVQLSFPVWDTGEQHVISEYLEAHPTAARMLGTGDVPDELAGKLESAPPEDRIDIECPCREKRRPCLHALAAYYALVERIDQEPALALTLRGYQRPEERRPADRVSIPLEELDARGFFESAQPPGPPAQCGGTPDQADGEGREARQR